MRRNIFVGEISSDEVLVALRACFDSDDITVKQSNVSDYMHESSEDEGCDYYQSDLSICTVVDGKSHAKGDTSDVSQVSREFMQRNEDDSEDGKSMTSEEPRPVDVNGPKQIMDMQIVEICIPSPSSKRKGKRNTGSGDKMRTRRAAVGPTRKNSRAARSA